MDHLQHRLVSRAVSWVAGFVVACGVLAVAPSDDATAAPPAPSPAAPPTASTLAREVQTPLVPGVSADPAITTYAGSYYLTYNKDGFANSIVMRVAPSLGELYHATDHVVWEGKQGPAEVRARVGLGSWLLHWGGRWYLYGWGDDGSSVTTSIPFVLESDGDDPLGPYRFKALFSSPSPDIGGDGHGYAASPIRVGDRLYLTQTSRGQVFLAELADPWTLSTGWSRILHPASSGWECANGRCLDEGGSAAVHDGQVFLLFSAGGYESPDYCVGMATAAVGSDLRDPGSWTKSDDCVFAREDAAGAYGPASMIWFRSPDGREDWVAYHVKTTRELTGGDRALQAKRVRWRADGTPDFGRPLATGAFHPLPSGDPGYVVYEAEHAARSGGRVVRSERASAGRYVALAGGDSLTLSVPSPAAGMIPVYLWVRSETGHRPRLAVRVNDAAPLMLDVPAGGPSAGFDASQFATVSLPLRAGSNTIALTGTREVAGLDRVWIDPTMTGSGAAAVQLGERLVVFDTVDGRVRATSCHDDTCQPFAAPPTPPAPLVGYPGAVSRDGDSVDLVAVGANGALLHTAYRNGSWSDWDDRGTPPPGIAAGGSSVAARTPDNLDVYVLGTDGRLWSTAWEDSRGWIGWFAPDQRGHGVGQVSAPSGVGRRPNQLDLASVGTDGQVWLTWWNGAGWNRSYPVGAPPGGATSAAGTASRTPDSIDLVVRGTGGDVWSVTFTEASGWTTWQKIPGQLPGGATSAPAVATNRATTTTTAVIQANGTWWSATLQPHGWTPWQPQSAT